MNCLSLIRVHVAVLALCLGAMVKAMAAESETPEAKAHREKVEQLEREIALLNKQTDLLKAQSGVAAAILAQKKTDADLAATSATAEATANAAVKKAEQDALTTELDNAAKKADLQAKVLDNIGKVGIPDLKGQAATAPTLKLPATALGQIHVGTDALAEQIGGQIKVARTSLPVAEKCTGGRPLIMADSTIRTMLMRHRATSTGIRLLAADVRSRDRSLRKRKDSIKEAFENLEELGKPPKLAHGLERVEVTGGPIAALKIASVLTQSAVHLAAATKRAYGAELVDGKTGVAAWFQARVLQEVAVPILDPQAILTAGLGDTAESPLLEAFDGAVDDVEDLRVDVRDIEELVADSRIELLPPKGEKAANKAAREELIKLINEVAAEAKEATKFADATVQRLEGLWTSSGDQPTPMEVALRGEALLAATKDNCAVLLDLTLTAAQVDMVGSDSLFGGVRMAAGGTFSAHWRLTTPEGLVVGQGTAALPLDFRQVAVGAFKKPDTN